MPTDTLQGTGENNGNGKDLNSNENMDNVLTSNVYLNDQKNIFLQTGRLDTGVKAGEIRVCWDRNHDFFKSHTILCR